MEITYLKIQEKVAKLNLNGKLIQYSLPLPIGTHTQVFQAISTNKKVKIAQKEEIVAYVYGALIHKKDEWADQELIRFPTKNYLRMPNVLTIVPIQKEYGDLEGGMLVDSDLSGEGIKKQTEIPKDISGWKNKNGLFIQGKKIFVPYYKWYTDKWDGKNGAVIALFGEEGAEGLERIAKDSGRTKIFWKVNPEEIKTPERRVPVLDGDSDDRLDLKCDDSGDSNGCGVGYVAKN